MNTSPARPIRRLSAATDFCESRTILGSLNANHEAPRIVALDRQDRHDRASATNLQGEHAVSCARHTCHHAHDRFKRDDSSQSELIIGVQMHEFHMGFAVHTAWRATNNRPRIRARLSVGSRPSNEDIRDFGPSELNRRTLPLGEHVAHGGPG